jgi:hypothetical protein
MSQMLVLRQRDTTEFIIHPKKGDVILLLLGRIMLVFGNLWVGRNDHDEFYIYAVAINTIISAVFVNLIPGFIYLRIVNDGSSFYTFLLRSLLCVTIIPLSAIDRFSIVSGTYRR